MMEVLSVAILGFFSGAGFGMVAALTYRSLHLLRNSRKKYGFPRTFTGRLTSDAASMHGKKEDYSAQDFK